MIVFRVAKSRLINDLSGQGSSLYGGRWNSKGIRVIYTSESKSLAMLEYLVHLNILKLPRNLSIAAMEMPEKTKTISIQISSLPAGWAADPPPRELLAIGDHWAAANESLLLRVPSAVVKDACNIIINPAHPDTKNVRVIKTEKWDSFDRFKDLFKPKKSGS